MAALVVLPACATLAAWRSMRLDAESAPHPSRRARRRALSHPPSVGYSQQCLLARGSVLKRAVETLLDPQAGGGCWA